MADGCNLYCTKKDLEQIEKSLKVGTQPEKVRIEIARNSLNSILKNNVDGIKGILAKPDDLRYKIVQELLIKSLSHGQLTRDDELKLAPALKTVLDVTKNPQGLFEKPPVHRGPGSTAMSHGYELLCAAALIQKKVTTSLGNSLEISRTDRIRIDFGEKFAGRYALSTKKKNTGESDILIYIYRGGKEIGIDAKYTTKSVYRDKPDLPRELNAIRSAFSDYQLQEFYFVTNAQFHSDFKKLVDDTNAEIIQDWAARRNEIYRNFKDLTPIKKKITDVSKMRRNLDFHIDFHNKRKEINELTQKYGIPQIGICERVNFEKH